MERTTFLTIFVSSLEHDGISKEAAQFYLE